MAVSNALIEMALVRLGGQAPASQIRNEIMAMAQERQELAANLPATLLQTIRAKLQQSSSDASPNVFRGQEDLFQRVPGKKWRLRDVEVPIDDDDEVPLGDEFSLQSIEGGKILRLHFHRERSRSLVATFKRRLISFACCVCDFDFVRTYGPIGNRFIEAHHVVPLSDLAPRTPAKLSDLIPVCSNCHSMLHVNGALDWRSLRAQLR